MIQSTTQQYLNSYHQKKITIPPQFWSAYVGCSSQFKDSVPIFLEQIDVIKRLVNRYPNDMQFVTTASGEKSLSLDIDICNQVNPWLKSFLSRYHGYGG